MRIISSVLFKTILLFTLVVCALGINYLQAAWTPAPANPPSGNVEAPVNISATDQIKLGGLTVAGLGVYGSEYVQDKMSIASTGPSADLTLDVEGKVGATEYCDQNGANCVSSSGIGGGSSERLVAILEDQKPSGTSGGTFVSGGVRRTRTLNTTVLNEGSVVTSLASNRFTLAAGSYRIEWSAPAHYVDWHKSYLRNITTGTDAGIGTSEFAANGRYTVTHSEGDAVVTFASPTIFEIQHRCRDDVGSIANGLGYPSGFGENEVYTRVKIYKR